MPDTMTSYPTHHKLGKRVALDSPYGDTAGPGAQAGLRPVVLTTAEMMQIIGGMKKGCGENRKGTRLWHVGAVPSTCGGYCVDMGSHMYLRHSFCSTAR